MSDSNFKIALLFRILVYWTFLMRLFAVLNLEADALFCGNPMSNENIPAVIRKWPVLLN